MPTSSSSCAKLTDLHEFECRCCEQWITGPLYDWRNAWLCRECVALVIPVSMDPKRAYQAARFVSTQSMAVAL